MVGERERRQDIDGEQACQKQQHEAAEPPLFLRGCHNEAPGGKLWPAPATGFKCTTTVYVRPNIPMVPPVKEATKVSASPTVKFDEAGEKRREGQFIMSDSSARRLSRNRRSGSSRVRPRARVYEDRAEFGSCRMSQMVVVEVATIEDGIDQRETGERTIAHPHGHGSI